MTLRDDLLRRFEWGHGATSLGLSIVVDQPADDIRRQIGRVHALVSTEELGPSA